MQSDTSEPPKPNHLPKSPIRPTFVYQSDNSAGCCLLMPSDISATPKFEKLKAAASPSSFAASASVINEKTFLKSKLNITVNNYASKPVVKEVMTAEEMMIDLKAMRESLGLTPIKQNEDAEKSESDCIL